MFQPILVFRSLFETLTRGLDGCTPNCCRRYRPIVVVAGGRPAIFFGCGRHSRTYSRIRCLNSVDAGTGVVIKVLNMKTSTFRIVPLSTDVAEAARRGAASGMPDHTVVVADLSEGYPCRHCLRFAKRGERLILFPYASIPGVILTPRLGRFSCTNSGASVIR